MQMGEGKTELVNSLQNCSSLSSFSISFISHPPSENPPAPLQSQITYKDLKQKHQCRQQITAEKQKKLLQSIDQDNRQQLQTQLNRKNDEIKLLKKINQDKDDEIKSLKKRNKQKEDLIATFLNERMIVQQKVQQHHLINWQNQIHDLNKKIKSYRELSNKQKQSLIAQNQTLKSKNKDLLLQNKQINNQCNWLQNRQENYNQLHKQCHRLKLKKFKSNQIQKNKLKLQNNLENKDYKEEIDKLYRQQKILIAAIKSKHQKIGELKFKMGLIKKSLEEYKDKNLELQYKNMEIQQESEINFQCWIIQKQKSQQLLDDNKRIEAGYYVLANKHNRMTNDKQEIQMKNRCLTKDYNLLTKDYKMLQQQIYEIQMQANKELNMYNNNNFVYQTGRRYKKNMKGQVKYQWQNYKGRQKLFQSQDEQQQDKNQEEECLYKD